MLTKLLKKVLWRKSFVCDQKENKAVVLLYHRVFQYEQDPQFLAVTPKRFEAQIKYLKKNYRLIRLSDLVMQLKTKRVQDKSIVITFDDGYYDNLKYAKPILEKYRVPATVFLVSGLMGGNKEFWWDELERIFLICNQNIYKILDLNINGEKYIWDIKTFNDVKRIYQELHTLLKYMPEAGREKYLAAIREWANVSEAGRSTHRVLAENEIKELVKGGLIEIGAHTITHPRLSNETLEAQRYQIIRSKNVLEQVFGKSIDHFSYPFGSENDFSKKTVGLIYQAGFLSGVTNQQGFVTNKTNLYQMPRQLVRDWPLNKFSQVLREYFTRREIV